ncbi:hypothetical protein CBR67_03940 [Bordetella hinzii]|uniref:hypothetical protein n=1 Tax=Bordetella hinzii TaxID=103855 RepID=UPI0011509947|nr:hypothetical protein [Bordetella hinzii]QDJ35868.1 hypothetical protein CBR67_03940 [Bordetella hinzii]
MFDALSQDYPGPLEPVSLPDTVASRPTPPAAVQQLTPYDNTPAPDVDIAGQAPAASAEPIPKAIARTIHRALVAFSDAELARLRNLQTPEKSASNLYGAGRLAAQQNIDDVDAALNWLAAPVAAQAPIPEGQQPYPSMPAPDVQSGGEAEDSYSRAAVERAMRVAHDRGYSVGWDHGRARGVAVQAPAAAGDALDAVVAAARKIVSMPRDHGFIILTVHVESLRNKLDALDAAIAAQQQGEA